MASADEADPEHPQAVGEAYAAAIPGARLVLDEPGQLAGRLAGEPAVGGDRGGRGRGAGRVSPPAAGYSGTPLPRKLGIKPGARLALLDAPKGFDTTLGELPPGVGIRRRVKGPLDVIVAFCLRRAELEPRLASLAAALDPAGGLWIAWPKRASGVATDLTDTVVRELGLAAGLVDNKVCAIDEVWSGLRFVYRLRDRPAGPARAAERPSRPSPPSR